MMFPCSPSLQTLPVPGYRLLPKASLLSRFQLIDPIIGVMQSHAAAGESDDGDLQPTSMPCWSYQCVLAARTKEATIARSRPADGLVFDPLLG
jgi:hypothetical protein